MERTLTSDISSKIGEKVKLQGWLYQLRELGTINFLVIRDRKGLAQAIIENPDEIEKLRGMQAETVLEIEGMVVEEKRASNGAELHDVTVTILNAVKETPPVVINKKELDLNLDTLLDYRPLTMRNIKQQAIFRIHGAVQQAYREYMLSQDVVEFFPPTLLTGSSEGGSELFTVEYFEGTAKLSQSAQLYKQICIGVYERVFGIAKCFRAEKYGTSRHLTEATQYEFEMAFVKDIDDILYFLQETIRSMVNKVKNNYAKDLATLGVELMEVPEKIPTITMEKAQLIVYEESKGALDDRAEPDMSPEGERLIAQWARREQKSNYVFITHYPRKKRAFYSMPDPDNKELTLSYDCIAVSGDKDGFEIASGAIRINDYDMLVQSAIDKGLDPATIQDYLNIFKYGMPRHGGFGMGVERFTQGLLGFHNVREVTMFPRDVNRLRP
ncbi:MAG: aspartate--tRNA(Asn) ligase [bacterium]